MGADRRPPLARKRFGQHFLEPRWVHRVVAALAPRPGELFLEIGAGRGALTLALASTGARVIAVEIDRRLAETLAHRAPPSVEIVTADFLTLDVSALVGERLRPGEAFRIAGNIPYGISTPILFRLFDLVAAGLAVRDATLMVQREVGARIVAPPGSREYGPLSIFTRLYAEAQPLLTLPPGAFRPPPRVYSTVVRLTFRPRQVEFASEALFRELVRGLFTQRRKTLLNALKPLAVAKGLDGRRILEQAGIAPDRRPETLDLGELARLTDVVAGAAR